jgi:hypothetical protein
VDDGPQFEYYRAHGHFAGMPWQYGELAGLVSGPALNSSPGRYQFVVNLGLALEDVSTAHLLYRTAIEREIGTILPC